MTAASCDVSIVTSGHDVADARLHRIVAALVRVGLAVEVLGTGRSDDGPAGACVRTDARSSLFGRAFRSLVMPWRARGAILVTFDPDAVIGCEAVRHVRRRKLVVDVHEDYVKLLDDRAWSHGLVGVGARSLARIATFCAARADLTSVADEHLPPRSARDRLVVRNLPDVNLLPAAAPVAVKPRACYIGDLRRSRGLFEMLDAVAAAPGWELDLVGPVAASDQEEAKARAELLGDRVRWHGRLPPHEAWKVASGAWVGMALLGDTPAFREAVPSKLYEYLACGLVPLVSELPRQAEVVTAADVGAVVADAAEAAARLRTWASEPALIDTMRSRGREWIDREILPLVSYDRLAERVAALAAR